MRDLNLTRDDSRPSTHPMNRLMDDLVAIETQGGRVYRTYCCVGGRRIELTATNKEVHLYLGTLTEAGQNALCEILLAEFGHGPCYELMLKDPVKGSTMYVTFIERNDRTMIVNISPAQRPSHQTH